jgi:hypothetical protein
MTPTPNKPALPERLGHVELEGCPGTIVNPDQLGVYSGKPIAVAQVGAGFHDETRQLAAELVHRYNHYEQIKKQLSDLLAVLDAHETESFQCDRKEATYCDCLTRSKMAAKAALAAAEKGQP